MIESLKLLSWIPPKASGCAGDQDSFCHGRLLERNGNGYQIVVTLIFPVAIATPRVRVR